MKVSSEHYFGQHVSVGFSWFYNEPLTINYENAHCKQLIITFYLPLFAWDIAIIWDTGEKEV